MERCAHSVYCVPADWRAQEAWRIPASRRVSWFCWICREYGDREFSLEKLKQLAMANCVGKLRPVRKTEIVPITNPDYELPEPDGDPLVPEEIDDEHEPLDEAA